MTDKLNIRTVLVFGLTAVFLLPLVISGHKPRMIDHGVHLDAKTPLNIAHRGASGMLPEHTGLRMCTYFLASVLLLPLVTSVAIPSRREPRTINHGVNLDTKTPLNIAHRGACGLLPEHTVESYRLAVEQGADVIECDLMITKDRQLVCLHDSSLDSVTDVSTFTKFADRRRSYNISNEYYDETRYETITDDWFSVDFTLSELKELRKRQQVDIRNQEFNGKYQIATLEEFIQVAKNVNRTVGLHIETKFPRWVNSRPFMSNTTMEKLLVQVLERNGYNDERDPCFLQSFEQESLIRLRNLTRLPLVRLIDYPVVNTSNARLAEWSEYLYGIGPWKDVIVPYHTYENGYKNDLSDPTDLVERAHNHGLKVHTYTFRNEDRYLSWTFNQDPVDEYDYFINTIKVDGLFTDFPKTLTRYLDSIYRVETEKGSCETGMGSRAAFSKSTMLLLALVYSLLI